MPVIKSGNKWTFGGKEYDTEEAAENAYKAYLAIKFGTRTKDEADEDKKSDKAKKAKKKTKSKSKKKPSKDDENEEY